MSDSKRKVAVTVKEATELLATNHKQIRRGMYARELPVVRFENSHSIGVDDLRAWFNRKKAILWRFCAQSRRMRNEREIAHDRQTHPGVSTTAGRGW
jgi:hypothetical protein